MVRVYCAAVFTMMRCEFVICRSLVTAENVARVDFCLHVVEAGVVAVGDDGLTFGFETVEIVHYLAAENVLPSVKVGS